MATAPQRTETAEPNGDPAWRTGNIGRLMFAATDQFVRDKLRESGLALPSEAMLALFLNLDGEGSRLTTLAARAGQTKQSMIELVDKAEASRLIERRPDPVDLRAKTVCFTPLGLAMLDQLEHGIAAAERRFAAIVGEAFADELKEKLASYIAQGGGGAAAGSADAAETPWRQRNVGRFLAIAARCFARDLLGVVHRRGHREVNEVLLALFRNLDLDGTRLTKLAERARMTKQSMRELVDRAEALGLTARRPDPADRRAKIVMFTPDGLSMLEAVRGGVARAEERFSHSVGAPFAGRLRARLTDYLGAPAPAGQTVPATGSSGIATTAFDSANSSTP